MKLTTKQRGLVLLAGLILVVYPTCRAFATPGQQQNQTARVFETCDDKQLEQILREMNIEFQAMEPGAYRIYLQAQPVFIKNDKSSLHLFSFFRKAGLNVHQMNAWNKEMQFSRAHLDKDGDGVLESDLDLEGGVTANTVKVFIRTYNGSLLTFMGHLNAPQSEEPSKSAAAPGDAGVSNE